MVAYLRRLDPNLPRQVWLVQAGGVVNSLGNGIVLPFVVIYLHNVRGISFAEAGLALAFGGVAGAGLGLGCPGRSSTGSAVATRCCSDCCCRPWPSRSSL